MQEIAEWIAGFVIFGFIGVVVGLVGRLIWVGLEIIIWTLLVKDDYEEMEAYYGEIMPGTWY